MSQNTLKFQGILPGGINYELHEAMGFSDRVEIALKIGGEISTILVVERRRSGSIVCKPVQSRTVTIKETEKAETTKSIPTLDDVV